MEANAGAGTLGGYCWVGGPSQRLAGRAVGVDGAKHLSA